MMGFVRKGIAKDTYGEPADRNLKVWGASLVLMVRLWYTFCAFLC